MTPKQQAFVQAILEGRGPSEAYRLAYNTKKMLPATIKNNAYKLSQRNDIATTIAERRQVLANKAQVAQERLVEELARVAFADMAVYASWGPDGVTLKEHDQLPEGASVAVAEVSESVTRRGRHLKFKLHDKKGALDSLARILGYDKPDPRGDQPVQVTRLTVVLPPGHGPEGTVVEGSGQVVG